MELFNAEMNKAIETVEGAHAHTVRRKAVALTWFMDMVGVRATK